MQDIPFFDGYGQLSFRWLHLIAGVVWIGILYFFNWVNTAFAPTMDADTKKKVVPELMPRALYWFRWGAAWTWVTGVILLFLLYYHGNTGYFYDGQSEFSGEKPQLVHWLVPFALLFVGFVVYDQLFKLMAGQHAWAVVIWGVITVAYGWVLSAAFDASGRAVLIHMGALFGTSMAANVWMRIWPAQRRIITATKNGEAPDPADPKLAGLRSKHNTYMSVPLLLFMVSVDQGPITGSADVGPVPGPVLWGTVALAVGWLITFALYKKAPKVQGF